MRRRGQHGRRKFFSNEPAVECGPALASLKKSLMDVDNSISNSHEQVVQAETMLRQAGERLDKDLYAKEELLIGIEMLEALELGKRIEENFSGE